MLEYCKGEGVGMKEGKMEYDGGRHRESRRVMRRVVESLVHGRVLLVDDNFELQSVRAKYYKIAKQKGSAYLEIQVTASLSQCLRQNREREKVVDD